MSMIQSDLLLGQEGGAGYVVERSLRFSSIDSAYLSRTPASAGNRKTWTWAGWVKRSAIADSQRFFGTLNSGGTLGGHLQFTAAGELRFVDYTSGGTYSLVSSSLYRDPSAWYHIVCAFDTTQATASNRIKLYVNNVLLTAFSTANYHPQNTDGELNNATTHGIGRAGDFANDYFTGYFADIHFIDGQALDPSAFVAVSATTGQLIPKKYSGPTPTGNSFWLPFSDNSAANATTLGKDGFLLGNNWTPNNFVASAGTVYSSFFSAPNGTLIDAAKGFDGNTGTYAIGTNGRLLFSPSPGIPFTNKVEVFNPDGSPTESMSLNGGPPVVTRGMIPDWTVLANGTSGTINTINCVDSSGGDATISAIRVDGVILINGAAPKDVDSLVDTPSSGSQVDTGLGGQVTGNYCTWNPLAVTPSYQASSLTNGNLDAYVTGNNRNAYSTIAFPVSGKYFFEVTLDGSFSGAPIIGVSTFTGTSNAYPSYVTTPSVVYNWDGTKTVNGSTTAYGATYGAGAVIGVAVDIDSSTVTFYKNGSSQGPISLNVAGAMPHVGSAGATGTYSLNAGARPFAYTAPSGFKALCDTNLPAPVVAKSSDYFQTVLYTGNGSTQTISGLGFSPDLVWSKYRGSAGGNVSHLLYDTVRGVGPLKGLNSDQTRAEGSCFDQATGTGFGYLSAFNSDGYTVVDGNQSSGYVNYNGHAYVAWAWDAGSSTVTNTQGSITSQVRTNGYLSIVTYTGNNTNSTVGHGLGVTPELIIVKTRTTTDSWAVYHKSLGVSSSLFLNSTSAAVNEPQWWASTAPTSTVFSVGTPSGITNANGANYVAYCFSPVAGYSAMGSYVGNSSSDGVYISLGFKPKFLMVKNITLARDWLIWDSARNPYNEGQYVLKPHVSAAEESPWPIDLLSNGFKLRHSSETANNSSSTYIYFAVAESPFQYARAR